MRPVGIQALLHRWPLAAALAVSTHLLIAGVGVAEEDHLKGYKGKDLDKIQPPGNYTLTNQFGSETCELKKAKFFLVQSEKNAGNDPRGGAPGNFICYKAKCTGTLPPDTELDDQFGVHTFSTKKAQLLCVPAVSPVAQTCGNNTQEGTETCDGTADTTCPGDCLSDCTCAPTCGATGGNPTVCSTFGISSVCYSCCDNDPACGPECQHADAVACALPTLNDSCASAANAAGCAAECCP